MDDLIIMGASEAKVKEFKKTMMKIFCMTDLGLLCSYFGIEVHQSDFQKDLPHKPNAAHILENYKWLNAIRPILQRKLS